MKGYIGAEQRPSQNYWSGFDQRDFIVIHATASGDKATEYVPDFSAATGKSTHYAIAMDGHIVQYVDEDNSAWGNYCATGNSTFRQDYNWNKSTISIENEKHSNDNSIPLTDAQYKSLLVLVHDIAKRWNIPLVHGKQGVRGIIYHHDLDPINKARCPGNFPYDTFFQDLNAVQGGQQLKLNNQGMVLDIVKSFQLEDGESGDLCGMWSVGALKYAGLPGQGPTGSAEDVDKWADGEADKYGSHLTWPGSSISDMHNFLHDAGNLHYWDIPSDVTTIRKAVQAGYPVIFTANEANIISKKTGRRAYPWQLDVNHILPVCGLDKDGDFICPDQLNNSYQGEWPCIYLASRLNPSWATCVQVVGPNPNKPWLVSIPGGDPNKWQQGFNAQLFATQTPLNTNQQKQFQDIWNSTASLNGGKPFDYTTGIANEWKTKYCPKFLLGPAVTSEFHSVDWNGGQIIVQLGLGWECQYILGKGGRWWQNDHEITY